LAIIERLQQDIEFLRNCSEPCEAGTTRLSYTNEYRKGANYIKKQMEDAGLAVREDSVGNIYGLLEGRDPYAPKIITGSHLDTVRCAGAFDGMAGVVCALEVARMLRDNGERLNHSFEVLGTIEEEGSSFGQVLLGSQFIEGSFGEKELDLVSSNNGKTLRQILTEYSQYESPMPACRREDKIKAFIELHTEQGPILESLGIDIGIVERIVAISWLNITVTGFAGHSGTVPMNNRQDAGIGAFNLIVDTNRFVKENYAESATATIGQIKLSPGSSNCIPSKCSFTVDLRSGEINNIEEITRYIHSQALCIEKQCGVAIDIRIASLKHPIQMDKQIQNLIKQSCNELGYTCKQMNSGAGHDAMIFARRWKTGMIFIPCVRGITHHPEECVTWENMAIGTDVLYKTILHLDK